MEHLAHYLLLGCGLALLYPILAAARWLRKGYQVADAFRNGAIAPGDAKSLLNGDPPPPHPE